MNGESHYLVAMLAMACMNSDERSILYPRWGAIEAGAVLSDHFRIMWEPDYPESSGKSLVHRCFIDSPDSKDHGCVIRALDHSEGSISYIKSFMDGEDGHTETEFLEDLGMFLGILSHHIADLCTPLHVRQNVDFRKAGFRSRKAFHDKLERDIQRLSNRIELKMAPPKTLEFSEEYFRDMAKYIYENYSQNIEALYSSKKESGILELVSDTVSIAVNNTRDAWHTILAATKMTERKWSYQPLL